VYNNQTKEEKTMITLSTEKAKQIAELLETTMCSHGIFDDWDETVHYLNEDAGKEHTLEFADSVQTAVEFINQFKSDEDKINYDFVQDAKDYLNSFEIE
jgi:hypothetical protein